MCLITKGVNWIRRWKAKIQVWADWHWTDNTTAIKHSHKGKRKINSTSWLRSKGKHLNPCLMALSDLHFLKGHAEISTVAVHYVKNATTVLSTGRWWEKCHVWWNTDSTLLIWLWWPSDHQHLKLSRDHNW